MVNVPTTVREAPPLIYGTMSGGTLHALGNLTGYNIDIAWGLSENNFELQTGKSLQRGNFIWFDGTGAGGIVDSIGITADNNLKSYKGRTWFAILADKIVEPPAGQAYRTVAGTASQMLSQLLSSVSLEANQPGGLFTVQDTGGANLGTFQVDRYVSLWSVLVKMCTQYARKLSVYCDGTRVFLSLAQPVVVSADERTASLSINSGNASPTHLIGLGSGELTAREIVHRYINSSGQILTSPPVTGWQDITQTYEATDKKGDDLVRVTEKKLKELQSTGSGDIDFKGDARNVDPWDIINAQDWDTGISLQTGVKKKIFKVSKNRLTTSIELGSTADSPASSRGGGRANL